MIDIDLLKTEIYNDIKPIFVGKYLLLDDIFLRFDIPCDVVWDIVRLMFELSEDIINLKEDVNNTYVSSLLLIQCVILMSGKKWNFDEFGIDEETNNNLSLIMNYGINIAQGIEPTDKEIIDMTIGKNNLLYKIEHNLNINKKLVEEKIKAYKNDKWNKDLIDGSITYLLNSLKTNHKYLIVVGLIKPEYIDTDEKCTLLFNPRYS